jgi:hypothetical protein
MSVVQYFNFPIQLIDGIFKDKYKALTYALYYALYSHSLKLSEDEYYNNPALKKFIAAAKWYNVNLGGNEKNQKEKFSRGKALYDSIPEKSVKVGLNISIFWDYYTNDKTDFDIACLAVCTPLTPTFFLDSASLPLSKR